MWLEISANPCSITTLESQLYGGTSEKMIRRGKEAAHNSRPSHLDVRGYKLTIISTSLATKLFVVLSPVKQHSFQATCPSVRQVQIDIVDFQEARIGMEPGIACARKKQNTSILGRELIMAVLVRK